MLKDKLEKLTEHIMGEAVIALLDSNDRISGATLANRLKSMLRDETDAGRQEAIEKVLAEVQSEFASARDPVDSAALAFGQSVPDNSRKHKARLTPFQKTFLLCVVQSSLPRTDTSVFLPASRHYHVSTKLTLIKKSIMQNTIDTQQSTTEAEIMRLFRGAGDKLEAESAVLDAVIRNIVIQGQKVTSKAIIINLIAELESTEDVVQLDVLRSCLEIVVGRTCSQEEQA
ncbi:Hypothetical Protein PANA_3432 [Pantoea ananatis LMG 20103]|uniref:Uncharacterized protein n=3 Tax=Pantoea ananas TaxID=553 RepID=D4GNP4_PANAM|nr:Hypothetical Protein PANA_3432 [Pantoea ananatis LMG 20103]